LLCLSFTGAARFAAIFGLNQMSSTIGAKRQTAYGDGL
jgi:hypothetical protein